MLRALVTTLLVAGAWVPVVAQTAPVIPTASQLERERARVEAERKGMFDAANPATRARPAAGPSDAELDREMRKVERERKALFDPDNPATRPAPNAFPNVPTPERSTIDLEALARRYERKAASRKTDGLMVFASFSMPAGSLKKLVNDTARAGGVVVLRGFKNGSIRATAVAVRELADAAGGVQINPDAFTKYRVTAVPAVVLVRPEAGERIDSEGCALPDAYVRVSGDVGLSYALGEIERRSSAFREMAVRYGRPLTGAHD